MVNLDDTVKLEQRTTLGKGLGALRRDGLVPAVIHNHGGESLHVTGTEKELGVIYRAAGKHHPLNLQVGSDTYLALIKDVHVNPVKRQMQHVVFQAIKQNEKVNAEVPLHLEGEIPAEKIGLMVLHQLDHLEIEAFPRNLPDQIVVDMTILAELGDKIIVADLKAPEGVTILTDPEHPIAVVVETKAQESEEAAEAAEGEGVAEGETAEGAEAAPGDQAAESSDKK